MSPVTKKTLETIGRELKFIGREVQRIKGANSEDFESIDAIAQAVQIALTAALEIELDAQPATDELIAA
jgi:hypothetical protein